jgi:hypothetical protein
VLEILEFQTLVRNIIDTLRAIRFNVQIRFHHVQISFHHFQISFHHVQIRFHVHNIHFRNSKYLCLWGYVLKLVDIRVEVYRYQRRRYYRILVLLHSIQGRILHKREYLMCTRLLLELLQHSNQSE